MPQLDATLTLALPVSIVQLGAHLQIYRRSLPALNTLRACNRLGSGPRCYINRLPVELVQMIAHYHAVAMREGLRNGWARYLNCYEEDCGLLDHFSREYLVEKYREWREKSGHAQSHPKFYPWDPKDSLLYGVVRNRKLVFDEDYEAHDEQKEAWEKQLLQKIMTKDRPLFQMHFGLDIWLSQVCLGTSGYGNAANTTVAYITSRNRSAETRVWKRHETDDGYIKERYQSGFGMSVAMDSQPTPKDYENFKRAMRLLDLEVYIHPSQRQTNMLSLAPATGSGAHIVSHDAAAFPRPMLLVREEVEGD